MNLFDTITKIIVPIASPLIAALALIVAFRSERRKLSLQRVHDRKIRIGSVFTDALYASDLFKLMVYHQANRTLSQGHLEEFRKSFDRLAERIVLDPETGQVFYDHVRFRQGRNNMFTLLAEARIRVTSMEIDKRLDPLIYFALFTILYLYETDKVRREELYEAMTAFEDGYPDLAGPLMVARDTPTLHDYARV